MKRKREHFCGIRARKEEKKNKDNTLPMSLKDQTTHDDSSKGKYVCMYVCMYVCVYFFFPFLSSFDTYICSLKSILVSQTGFFFSLLTKNEVPMNIGMRFLNLPIPFSHTQKISFVRNNGDFPWPLFLP